MLPIEFCVHNIFYLLNWLFTGTDRRIQLYNCLSNNSWKCGFSCWINVTNNCLNVTNNLHISWCVYILYIIYMYIEKNPSTFPYTDANCQSEIYNCVMRSITELPFRTIFSIYTNHQVAFIQRAVKIFG